MTEPLSTDPGELQSELLEIANRAASIDIVGITDRFGEARREYETAKAQLKYLKDRASAIQSVLKSL
jgi:hypothetical protein